MDFTLTFIKLFLYGVVLASPLIIFFMVIITILGLIVGKKESWGKLESIYWSFITATTVGYGDITPVQKISKVLSIVIAFLGLILAGIIVALAVHAATVSLAEHHNVDEIKENVRKIK